ncbi:hypothetical protein J2S13_002942 [Oikeobacillus pervagus]|uniref:DUF4305 domain-containing protein n=1 Tax=Oikeobacillus pervagus TaxID=1325931 RepID=A0AAJ1WKF9_9BACI|nr:YdiK family protein [Oikeobacillus pervagus]MDQ0216483.1 hypothetical protein [Oikeobacillus pervagus]
MKQTSWLPGTLNILLGVFFTYIAIVTVNSNGFGFFTYLLILLATLDIGTGLRMTFAHFRHKKREKK